MGVITDSIRLVDGAGKRSSRQGWQPGRHYGDANAWAVPVERKNGKVCRFCSRRLDKVSRCPALKSGATPVPRFALVLRVATAPRDAGAMPLTGLGLMSATVTREHTA